MKMNSAVSYLRFLAFSQGIARKFGVNAALLIAYVIDRLPDEDEGAEIEASAERIEAATTLTWHQVNSARKQAKAILRFRHERLTHRSFWRVDLPALRELMTEGVAVRKPESPNLKSLDSGVLQTAIRGKGEDLKGKEKGAPNPVSEVARGVIQAFAGVYKQRFRKAYVPDPKGDVTAARSLIAAGVTPEEVTSVFDAATRTRAFWCSKVASLPDLAKRWNDVQAEIERVKGTGETTGGGQTPEEWAREITTLEAPVTGKGKP